MEKIKTKRLSFLMPGAALQLMTRGGQRKEYGATCSGCSLQLATFFYSSHMKCGNSAAIAAAHDLRKTIGGPSNQFESIRQPVFPAAGGAHTNGVDGGGTLNLAENGQQCARGVAANFTAHKKSRD